MIDVEVALLYVPDCPNRAAARELIELALARTHQSAVIREQEIHSSEEAERRGLLGSPTILIDGRDPFAAGAGPAAMSCRLYLSDAGSAASRPSAN